MTEKPQSPETEPKPANSWQRAAFALTVVAVIATFAPIVVHVAMSREAEPQHPCEREPRREAKASAEEEEASEPTPRSAGSSWMPFSGGGGHSSGGGSGSGTDILACNQAANAARRRAGAAKHPGLGKALDQAGGSLLGAAANSLHGVEVQTDDDARAAEAYSACISGR